MGKQLPENWVETELNSLCNIQSGGTPSRGIAEYWNGTIPWVKISDITSFYVNVTEEYITEEGLKNSSAKMFAKGTILFTIFATIGKISILNIDATTNQAIVGITQNEYIHKHFLIYALQNKVDEIILQGKGVAQNNINMSILKESIIPLPPLAEQERIAEKLDALFGQLDSVRGAMSRIPTLLANLRQQILTHAVTGKLTQEWRQGKNLEERQHTTIGTLFSVQTGATPHRENSTYYNYATIPWVKSGEVKNTHIFDTDEYISELAVKDTNAKIYPVDTLLIAMYGEGKTRGQVGWLKIPAASNQAIAALVNTNNELTTIHYVYFFCLSQYNEIRSQAKGGNQPNLNLTKIKNWQISLPTIEEQKEIVNRVQSLSEKLDSIEQRYQMLKTKLENLPQAILHKAFKGELVEQLPSDGNATDILREIEQLKKSLKKK